MKDDTLNELMESPLATEPGGGKRWIIAAVVVAVVTVTLLVLLSGGPVDNVAEGTTVSPSLTVAHASSTTAPPVVLVDYRPEPALLYHPTLLPLGWEKCRQIEDKSRGDRFCDPDQDDVWIQLAVRDADTVRVESAVPVPDAHGAMWLSQGDPVEIAVPVGTFSQLVALGNGVVGDDLLAVVESILLVSRRDALYGSYELPLAMSALAEEQLAELLATVDDDPRVVGQGNPQGDVQVYADNLTLSAFPNDAGGTVPDFATTLDLPRLLPADRPVVVGERPSRGRSYAIWDQRGFSWRLEGQLPLAQMEPLTLEVIDKVAALDVD